MTLHKKSGMVILPEMRGIALVKRFDGEFPEQYIMDCCKYMDISLQQYNDAIEKFRSPHLWEKKYGVYELKYPIWKQIDNE